MNLATNADVDIQVRAVLVLQYSGTTFCILGQREFSYGNGHASCARPLPNIRAVNVQMG